MQSPHSPVRICQGDPFWLWQTLAMEGLLLSAIFQAQNLRKSMPAGALLRPHWETYNTPSGVFSFEFHLFIPDSKIIILCFV